MRRDARLGNFCEREQLALRRLSERKNFAADARHDRLDFRSVATSVRQRHERQWMDGQDAAYRSDFAECGALHATLKSTHVRATGNVPKRLLTQAPGFAGLPECRSERTFGRHP